MEETELQRAWKYHEAADQLLNGRIQSLLIAQAFFIVGFAQIITSDRFFEEGPNLIELKVALCAVSLLAIVVTMVMRGLAAELSRGIRKLKKDYLVDDEKGDDVYKTYLMAVMLDTDRPRFSDFTRNWSGTIPNTFLVFWLCALMYSLYGAISLVAY